MQIIYIFSDDNVVDHYERDDHAASDKVLSTKLCAFVLRGIERDW